MKLSDFDFHLPSDLVAQKPSPKRDDSNLLVAPVDQKFQTLPFYKILTYFSPGDLLILNDSRVIKAKILLKKQDGVRKVELYLHKMIKENIWYGFAKPSKKLKLGDVFEFDNHKLTITKVLPMGEREISFQLDDISIFEFLDKYGHIPLPPYIKRPEENEPKKGDIEGPVSTADEERYQTVYSTNAGSIAAPTAGLHFTCELLDEIRKIGVEILYVTLHVGAGTFLPVKSENILEHRMHSELVNISENVALSVNLAKSQGRKIIAVGSTSLRAIESAGISGTAISGTFSTDIFIYPGFKFKFIDMLITNFHLPKTTLFMLVCAFAGRPQMINAYQHAIKNQMRFYSYGDSMLIYKNDCKNDNWQNESNYDDSR